MIEEQAIVVKNEGKYVIVNTQRQSSCGHCSVKNTCGTQVLSKVLGNKAAYVRCLNTIETDASDSAADTSAIAETSTVVDKKLPRYTRLEEGDRVIIGLQESALLEGSFLMYLLPLIIMIIAGGMAVYIAKLWWPEGTDLFALIASLGGLVTGLQLSHWRAKKHTAHNRFEPVVIRKLSGKEFQLKPILPA